MSFFDSLFGGADYGSKAALQSMNQYAGNVAQSAQGAQDFGTSYFNDYLKPQVSAIPGYVQQGVRRTNQISGMQTGIAKELLGQYQKYGIPAEDNYYKMVQNYSAPAEEERQAALGMGDVTQAMSSAQGNLQRDWAARGINPGSPAAAQASSDLALQGALARSTAANQARQNAKQLGMQLTSDAANFGRSSLSPISSFTQGAATTAGQGVGLAAQGVGATSGAASVPFQGYNSAITGFGTNMNGYRGVADTALNLEGKSDQNAAAGFGKLAGMAFGKYLGVPSMGTA